METPDWPKFGSNGFCAPEEVKENMCIVRGGTLPSGNPKPFQGESCCDHQRSKGIRAFRPMIRQKNGCSKWRLRSGLAPLCEIRQSSINQNAGRNEVSTPHCVNNNSWGRLSSWEQQRGGPPPPVVSLGSRNGGGHAVRKMAADSPPQAADNEER